MSKLYIADNLHVNVFIPLRFHLVCQIFLNKLFDNNTK